MGHRVLSGLTAALSCCVVDGRATAVVNARKTHPLMRPTVLLARRQTSQAIDPEVYSQQGRSSQGPDPSALSHLVSTGVMLLELIDNHDSNIGLAVLSTCKVLCHRRIFSPLVHDVRTMVVNSTMERLNGLSHVRQITPPAYD